MTDRLSTQQAAKHFNVHERTIRRWIKSGKLKAESVEGRWFVRIPDNDVQDADEGVRGNGQLRSESPQGGPVMDNARDNGHDERLSEHLTSEIQQLRDQLARRDEQIDHFQQIVAMSQKNIASLTEQLDSSRQMIEEMRHRSWWHRLRAAWVRR